MLNKKICCAILSLTFLLTGCKRAERPSSDNRYKDHKYDFVDYIDIYSVGVDGKGYLYVERKDITRDMFENDDEFVKVKKDLEAMDLHYVPNDRNNSKYLALSKTEELSNGDVINIGVSYNERNLNSDMNISTYPYTVSDLKDASEDVYVQPFDEEYVIFYGTSEDGKLYYMEIPDSRISSLLEPLEYSVTTEESKLVENGTLIDVELKKGRAKNDNVSDDMMLYFARNGFILETYEEELILSHVAKPIIYSTMTEDNYSELEQSLKNAIGEYLGKGNLKIYSLQRSDSYDENEKPYNYVVTYSYINNGESVYAESEVTIHKIDDMFNVLNVTRSGKIKQEDVNASTKNTILHVFNNE